MSYASAYTGPEIDAAVEMLGQVQSARESTRSDLAEVKVLASAVGAHASEVSSNADAVAAKTDQVESSSAAVELARNEVAAASAVVEASKDAAVLAATLAQTSQAAASASKEAAAQSQLAAGLSEQVSAENAAAAAAAAADVVTKLEPLNESLPHQFSRNLAFAVLDAANLETWLGINSIDGGPSEWAEHLLRRMFGILAGGRSGYLFAFPDANGVLTDLCVDDVTGMFPDFVVKRLAPRIAKELPQSSGDSLWLPDDLYTDEDGEVRRVFAKPLSWSGWGSSTIDEWVELGNIAAQFGATYYNGGNGATELHHNLAQMGARPALLLPQGGEIPASGAVVVACSNVTPVAAFKATTGSLAGVSGTLTCSATEWTFTRSAAGSAVAVSAETPFIPTNGLLHRGDLWLMNQGKNNINNNWPMDLTIALHKLAYNWNSAYNKRVIVMTHFGHTGNQSPSHTAKCKQLNDFINATYGGHVFNLAGYLCSAEIWADTGITPTAADLQNQAAGCLPGSLSRDNAAHMNSKARTAAANKLKAQLINMGWFKE